MSLKEVRFRRRILHVSRQTRKLHCFHCKKRHPLHSSYGRRICLITGRFNHRPVVKTTTKKPNFILSHLGK